MQDYRELAKQFIRNGIGVIPVKADKQPTINWIKYQVDMMSGEDVERYFKSCFGVAVVTKNIECIDFDLKYSLRSDFMDTIKEKVPTEILGKMWVQKTVSGGFHWLYLTDVAEPNQKLACRYTTAYERHETYMEAFNDSKTRNNASKIGANDKSRVLIETRGSIIENGKRVGKGYFLVAPTPGYEHIYGKLQKITDEEREILISVMREFNEVLVPKNNPKLSKFKKGSDVDVFSWYNEEGDVLGLLYSCGWELVSDNGKNYRLRRPGNPASKSSALFDSDSRVFTVFSTSNNFEPNKGYSPVDVFLELECGNDLQCAYEKLLELYLCLN
jgi:hypothetical protein